MKSIIDRMSMGGKTVGYALVAVFTLVVGAALPSFAADWTDANNVTYTALKSLKGNGDGQGYLVTEIVPNCTDIVMMKFKPVSASSALFCARDKDAKKQFACYHSYSSSKNYIRIDRDTSQQTSTSTVSTSSDYLFVADYGRKTATIVQSGLNTDLFGKALGGNDTYDVGSRLVFFAMHKNCSGYGNYGRDYIYYFELYDSNTNLTHCLMPAKCDSDSVYGFYDTRTRTFYPQSGGVFTPVARTVTVTGTCKKWTGLGADNKMSTGANWEGGVAPQAGDSLDFTLAAPLAGINADMTVTFGKVWIDDGDLPGFTGALTATAINDLERMTAYDEATADFAFTLDAPSGQDFTWNGGAAANWSKSDASWLCNSAASVWYDNNNAVFSMANATATLTANAEANSLVFNADATIDGSATITVPAVSVDSGVSATISAPTAGALEKTGAGTLVLTQNRAAQTTVSGGTLKMDGATVSALTLGTSDTANAVTFDYGGQTLTATPGSYLVNGSNVTLTNGTFRAGGSGGMNIRDDTSGNHIPAVLTIAADATLSKYGTSDNSAITIVASGDSTVNVAGGVLHSGKHAYFQHAGVEGTLRLNITDGGTLSIANALFVLCGGVQPEKSQNPGFFLSLDRSRLTAGSFDVGNNATYFPAEPTGVIATTNSSISVSGGFYIGRNSVNEYTAGSYTADFENCAVTSRYFAVYFDRPLNNARFNGTTFVFGNADGVIAASDGDAKWITVGEDGMTIDTQSYSATLNANLGGDGAVAKIGAGTLTVASNQTATAALNVSTGTLAVNGGVSIARPVTVASGTTLVINGSAQSAIGALTLAAGSTLNIASYTPGVVPLAVATLNLPAEGTIALTLNGGAFPEGIYAVYSKTGVTAAEGEKFSLATEGGIGYSWSVEDDTLVLTVGYVGPNAWTGRGGDGRMSTPGNWGGNAVPAAGADIDLSGISADTTIIADAGRTFGAVTMGSGVVTFTNSFAATSFSDTSKVAVGADSIVTIEGDLVFGSNVTACVCYSIAAGGMFAVTGDIIASAEHTGYVIPCIGQDSIPGTISCKGIVNNCGSSGDRFYLVRGKSNTLANWLVGEDGISGSKRFLIGNYNNSHANISARTNFTVSADIVQQSNLTLDTAGYTITLGTSTLARSGGILGGAANGLTTVTGTGKVVVDYNVNDLSSSASSRTNEFSVAAGATLTLNPGANIGFGTLTIASGTTLEVPKSGTVKLSGALDLEAGAILAFNFTNRLTVPCLDLNGQTTGDISEDITQVTVRVSSECGRPVGGEKTLVTGYDFTGEPAPALDAGKPQWVLGLSVNEDTGNLVLDVKPKGTMIVFR